VVHPPALRRGRCGGIVGGSGVPGNGRPSNVNLPNYFIADLPPEAGLRPDLITEAAETLKRNRERYLLPRPTESVVQAIAEVARQWLAPYSPWRAQALEHGAAPLGLSREVLGAGLDAFFRQVTPRNLNALLVQDLGHPQRLDRLVANDAETFQGTLAFARGPELLVHATADAVPVPVFTAIVHGLLVRSAQFVLCAEGAAFLPRLFAHSLRDVEPKLASCLELGAWGAGRPDLDEVLFDGADAVVATGTEERVEAVRRTVPFCVRFVGRGERVGAGYVAREVLGPQDEARVIQAAAEDVAAWDQLGGEAPHVVFVETGGMLPPEGFAEKLGAELARVEARLPRGVPSPAVEAALRQRRDFYRVRAAAGDTTRVWYSEGSTAWSVVCEADPQFQPSCGHRFVLVKAVDALSDCLHQAEAWRGRWTTVGLAATGLRAEELAQGFAAWGITRVCPLGRMQQPPLAWRRDGRPVLGDLVTWAGVERLD